MLPQPAIRVQEAAWIELLRVAENLGVMQYGADQREDLSALRRQGENSHGRLCGDAFNIP